MRVGKCMTASENIMGCYGDITTMMRQECHNRQSCSKSVIDLLSTPTTCPQGSLGYLEVSYYCDSGSATTSRITTPTVSQESVTTSSENSAVDIEG